VDVQEQPLKATVQTPREPSCLEIPWQLFLLHGPGLLPQAWRGKRWLEFALSREKSDASAVAVAEARVVKEEKRKNAAERKIWPRIVRVADEIGEF